MVIDPAKRLVQQSKRQVIPFGRPLQPNPYHETAMQIQLKYQRKERSYAPPKNKSLATNVARLIIVCSSVQAIRRPMPSFHLTRKLVNTPQTYNQPSSDPVNLNKNYSAIVCFAQSAACLGPPFNSLPACQ